jgi:hypothetical protein
MKQMLDNKQTDDVNEVMSIQRLPLSQTKWDLQQTTQEQRYSMQRLEMPMQDKECTKHV